jgi:hypothetical protein
MLVGSSIVAIVMLRFRAVSACKQEQEIQAAAVLKTLVPNLEFRRLLNLLQGGQRIQNDRFNV